MVNEISLYYDARSEKKLIKELCIKVGKWNKSILWCTVRKKLKELCIKVGKWNKSILWCTVRKTLNYIRCFRNPETNHAIGFTIYTLLPTCTQPRIDRGCHRQCTVYTRRNTNSVAQCKPTKCTFSKLIFLTFNFDACRLFRTRGIIFRKTFDSSHPVVFCNNIVIYSFNKRNIYW